MTTAAVNTEFLRHFSKLTFSWKLCVVSEQWCTLEMLGWIQRSFFYQQEEGVIFTSPPPTADPHFTPQLFLRSLASTHWTAFQEDHLMLRVRGKAKAFCSTSGSAFHQYTMTCGINLVLAKVFFLKKSFSLPSIKILQNIIDVTSWLVFFFHCQN